VARVELSAAVEDLEHLIRTHALASDAPARAARSLRALDSFPEIGPAASWSQSRTRGAPPPRSARFGTAGCANMDV
jgi:hypothetical protein